MTRKGFEEIARVALAYRVDDAATMLGLGRSKVWELIAEGRLPARKIDGATIVFRADLEAFLVATPQARADQGTAPTSLPIVLHLDPIQRGALDVWIADQPVPKPSRSEAVRALLNKALIRE